MATNAILLALTTELDPPFQRQQLLKGSLLPALSAIAEGRFEELRTIVLRMALTCPETMPLATSRLLGIPDQVRSVLDAARVAVAKACGFIQREGTPALDKTSNEFFTELDDAVSCLEGLKDSMQGFEEALASTVEILKALMPSNLDEYYLLAGHFEDRAAQEREEPDSNYAAHLQDQSDIACLAKGLDGKGTNFMRASNSVLVTVDSSTWSYGQSGIQVKVVYTYPREKRSQIEVFTNVSKVRKYLDTGVWKPAENKDH